MTEGEMNIYACTTNGITKGILNTQINGMLKNSGTNMYLEFYSLVMSHGSCAHQHFRFGLGSVWAYLIFISMVLLSSFHHSIENITLKLTSKWINCVQSLPFNRTEDKINLQKYFSIWVCNGIFLSVLLTLFFINCDSKFDWRICWLLDSANGTKYTSKIGF